MHAQISNHMHMFEIVKSCCPLSLVEACTDDWTYQEQVAIVPLEHAAEPFMQNYGSWDSEIKNILFLYSNVSKQFIEFVSVETNQLFRNNSKVILTGQIWTCGQRSA